MELSRTKQPGWPQLPAGFRFRMVSNIAEDSSGRIYFVHRGEKPLVRFDASGKFLGSLGDDELTRSVNYDLSKNPPAPISREYWMHGLHVDHWDNIWVTDLGRHLVLKFSPAGKLLMTLGTDGESGEDETHFKQPTAVAVGRSGDIFVADGYGNARIVKFGADGRYIDSWGRHGTGPGEFNTPHGIALDDEENVYVAERLNSRVQVFDANGRFLAIWPDLRRVDSVVVVPNGEVIVGTGYQSDTLFRFSRDGRRLGAIGEAAAFGYPHGILFDREGNLHVADPVAEGAAASPSKYPKAGAALLSRPGFQRANTETKGS